MPTAVGIAFCNWAAGNDPAARITCSVGRRIFLLELEDPGVSLIGDLGEEQQIVAAEGRRALPLLAVFVEAIERDVEPSAVLGRVSPNGGLYRARSYFGDWFLILP